MSDDHDVEVFNPAAMLNESPLIQGGVLISEPLGRLLGMMTQPRTATWLCENADATPDRLKRLAAQGLIEPRVRWAFKWLRRWVKPVYWRRTRKGEDWYLVWEREMARRRQATDRGPFLDRDLDQIPDNATFRTFEAAATGMRGTLIQVPHDPVARDVPWEPPADMVEVLGLLSETDVASMDYLVGANMAPGGTSVERVEQILPMLQSMGLATPRAHGWARTMMGTRMHVTWATPKEKPTP